MIPANWQRCLLSVRTLYTYAAQPPCRVETSLKVLTWQEEDISLTLSESLRKKIRDYLCALIMGDEDKGYNPGYSFYGRMLALAQVEGMMTVVDDEIKRQMKL